MVSSGLPTIPKLMAIRASSVTNPTEWKIGLIERIRLNASVVIRRCLDVPTDGVNCGFCIQMLVFDVQAREGDLMDLKFDYETYQDVRHNLFLYSTPVLIIAGFFTYFCVLPV